MKVDTAACFVLVSVALWLLADRRPRARPVALVLCAAVAFVALVTLAEYVLGRSFRIDLLLFHDVAVAGADAGTSEPGRMTPDKAVAFLLVAGALTALDTRRLGRWLPSGLAVGAALVAFVPVLGDVHGITSDYVVSDLVEMMVPAYAAFIALAAAILCARPSVGASRESTAAFCAMVGYPAEELIGMHYGAITHPDDRPPASEGALAGS